MKIPPPPLHTILIGPVNHIIDSLKQHYPSLETRLESLHIKRSNYHGKKLEGNQCRAVLKNISNLNIPPHLIEYEIVFYKLKALHLLCNEQILPCNYDKRINDFSVAWVNLSKKFNISTTPKVHIIMDHLSDYFEMTNLSLRKTTEEVVESMHQFVNKRLCKGYWVKDISNPNHGALLFRGIKHINCYNLRMK